MGRKKNDGSRPDHEGRTVLLLDGDEAFRAATCRILHLHGFRTLEAGDAAGALALLEVHPEPIHLVLCDLVLPGLGGREAAIALLARRPEAAVIYTSGVSGHDSFRAALTHEGAFLLSKPWEVPELLDAIRRALDL
ncbi:MAG: response regulator [Longimicrobiales bacterium]|nr:response regulator [Longimicrobiales bacterium]